MTGRVLPAVRVWGRFSLTMAWGPLSSAEWAKMLMAERQRILTQLSPLGDNRITPAPFWGRGRGKTLGCFDALDGEGEWISALNGQKWRRSQGGNADRGDRAGE